MLSTFAIVVFAFHVQEHKTGLKASNYVYVVASVLAVVSTIVIVVKTRSLDAEKDRVASVQIAQLKRDAATANKTAEETKQANLQLKSALLSHERQEKEAETKLSAKESLDYNHVLEAQKAQRGQNEVMQRQAVVSPQLTLTQVHALASALKPFAGQDVSLHVTSDTVVGRLAVAIKMAFNEAAITTKYYMTDIGALYQGVSVAVHDPKSVPPIANALVIGLQQAGIDVHAVSAPQRVAAGQVAVFLGPN